MLFARRSHASRPASGHHHHHSSRSHQSRGSKERLLRFAKRHDRLTIVLAVLLSAVLAAWMAGRIAEVPVGY